MPTKNLDLKERKASISYESLKFAKLWASVVRNMSLQELANLEKLLGLTQKVPSLTPKQKKPNRSKSTS